VAQNVSQPAVFAKGLITTFNQEFNNRHRYQVSPTPKRSDLVLDFIVNPSLAITSISLQLIIKILITYVNVKCLLHTSAVTSVRANVCVRPE
jgi:hypothetical protein